MASVPGTLGSMASEIANDLGRSDLSSDIRNAIIDAIDELSSNRLYFNTTRVWYFNTVVGTNYYPLYGYSDAGPGTPANTFRIDDFIQVDDMWINANNVWVQMTNVPPDQMEFSAQNNEGNGQPMMWAKLDEWEDYRISPRPNAIYLIRVMGHYRDVPLVNDSDFNYWFTISNAYYCVKARAKAQVYAEKMRNAKEAQIQMATASERLDALYRVTTRMAVSGRTGSRIKAHS